jgi:hypothetical protein
MKRVARTAASVLVSGLMLLSCGNRAVRNPDSFTFCPSDISGPKVTGRCGKPLGCGFTARAGDELLRLDMFGSEGGECSHIGYKRISIIMIRGDEVTFMVDRETFGRRTERSTFVVNLNEGSSNIPVLDGQALVTVSRTDDAEVVTVRLKLR